MKDPNRRPTKEIRNALDLLPRVRRHSDVNWIAEVTDTELVQSALVFAFVMVDTDSRTERDDAERLLQHRLAQLRARAEGKE